MKAVYVVPFLLGLGFFCCRLYVHRSRIDRLRRQGMPMPPWSWAIGHIGLLYAYTRSLPPFANVNLVFPEIAASFADTEMFLIDLWPVAETMLIVFNPEAAIQVAQKMNLPKAAFNHVITAPITGGPSMLSMNGSQWKTWRSLFNPGFSSAMMVEQTPQIVDSVSVFCKKLVTMTEKDVFSLDDLTTRLTFDIIMKVTLNADADHQSADHPLAYALDMITKWHSVWDVRVILNPLRPFIHAYYGNVIKTYIRKQLQARFQEVKKEHSNPASLAISRAKSVMTLAIEGYLASQTKPTAQTLDEDFAKMASHQIRLFLFAGNDTTSSTIVFTYHLLSKHPDALARMQREHDEIFGREPAQAGDRIKEIPALLNACPYTLAIIKETLRLYAPAATMRQGQTGSQLQARNGVSIPTDNLAILVTPYPVHRNPRVWPQPEAYLPERWLVGPEHALYPPPGAYRPFELGPRNCIGQSLTINEIKVVLIMTARTFGITPAYEEFDRATEINNAGSISSYMKRFGKAVCGEPIMTWKGDRAYPTDKAGAHPADGYPCRVELLS